MSHGDAENGYGLIYYVDIDVTIGMMLNIDIERSIICEHQLSFQKIYMSHFAYACKCGTRSTLCWKIPNISGSIELFAL